MVAAAGVASCSALCQAVQAICCSTKCLDVTHGTTQACTTSDVQCSRHATKSNALTFYNVLLHVCNHMCSSSCMGDEQTPTRNNVWHMHVLYSAVVLPDRGTRLAIPVALMGACPIPLHLLAFLGHSKVQTNARQGPAPCPLCWQSQAGWCSRVKLRLTVWRPKKVFELKRFNSHKWGCTRVGHLHSNSSTSTTVCLCPRRRLCGLPMFPLPKQR